MKQDNGEFYLIFDWFINGSFPWHLYLQFSIHLAAFLWYIQGFKNFSDVWKILTFWIGVALQQRTTWHILAKLRNCKLSGFSRANVSVRPSITRPNGFSLLDSICPEIVSMEQGLASGWPWTARWLSHPNIWLEHSL